MKFLPLRLRTTQLEQKIMDEAPFRFTRRDFWPKKLGTVDRRETRQRLTGDATKASDDHSFGKPATKLTSTAMAGQARCRRILEVN